MVPAGRLIVTFSATTPPCGELSSGSVAPRPLRFVSGLVAGTTTRRTLRRMRATRATSRSRTLCLRTTSFPRTRPGSRTSTAARCAIRQSRSVLPCRSPSSIRRAQRPPCASRTTSCPATSPRFVTEGSVRWTSGSRPAPTQQRPSGARRTSRRSTRPRWTRTHRSPPTGSPWSSSRHASRPTGVFCSPRACRCPPISARR
jgi:hypothetical protein